MEGKFNYYLIPGMGADRRIFAHFKLNNGVIHYLEWIDHGNAKNLADYAKAIAEQIKTENNILIGSSMGGMMAVELSRIIKPQLTVLVSAPIGIQQFPRILRIVKKIKIHKAVSPNTIPRLYKLADTFMGFKNEQQRVMFYEMMDKLGPRFIHFSVGAVLEWQNTIEPEGKYIQIVGTKDVLFDYKKMKQPYLLKDGGHFSAFDRGEEVSSIINDYIQLKLHS